jgi:hypothetical protein
VRERERKRAWFPESHRSCRNDWSNSIQLSSWESESLFLQ